MACLSIYRLKYLISVGIVITLLIGIALLYVLVYSFIISSITAQVQPDFRTLLIAVFLSTSILMILSSLSGIYGLIRRKNKFVVVYAATMVFYMVSFLLLGLFTVNSPQYVASQCDSGTPSEYESTVEEAKILLCKSDC
jgi:small-conductance mechanosensitive channel